MPIPSAEDDATSTTTPAVLKGLRQIYRDAYAKLAAARAANLKALTDPLTTRLKLLESDLTKKDRIADAKTVKEYREGLGKSSPGLQSAPASSASSAAAPSQNELKLSTTLKDGFTNSLGMKFVPVKDTDVLFCIHETRYKDYAAYADATQGVDVHWKDQSVDGFTPAENKADHPVMRVSWEEAQKFCTWLSQKEGKLYRLPTDREWSIAVGIGRDEKWKADTTPATVAKNPTDKPWGDKWPPPKGSGNYSDESRHAKVPGNNARYFEGYDDGYPTTAPVMSFKPNKVGLYDLSGNVWEWCEDWIDNTQKERLLRGGSWFDFEPVFLLSSSRRRGDPSGRGDIYGFRVVLVPSGTAPVTPPPAAVGVVPQTTPSPVSPATTAKSDFSNSLGMKFVKVPGTQVLFCIHETRRQDYAAYATEVPDVNDDWKFAYKDGIPVGDKDDHPVVSVNWDDANAFSAWLSKKEGRKYRLPTDKEWSYAVGIGRDEKWTKDTTPEMLHGKVLNEFLWGGDFPPRTKDQAGNYGDMTYHEKFPSNPFIEGYTDGFGTTAPVMSFKPNKLSIYDMGGNVAEFCDDWFNDARQDRVIRGGAWKTYGKEFMLSSNRSHAIPSTRVYEGAGFRIVVEMTAP